MHCLKLHYRLLVQVHLPAAYVRLDDAVAPVKSHLPQLFQNPRRRIWRLRQPFVYQRLERIHFSSAFPYILSLALTLQTPKAPASRWQRATPPFPCPTPVSGDHRQSGGYGVHCGEGGYYQISYHVNITVALLMGTRLMVNRTKVSTSVIEPLVSTSSFENRVQLNLTPNSTVSLQIFTKIIGTAILAGGGTGASLIIIRLGD